MSYPKEQIEFLQAVQDMRQAQQDYYRQPDKHRLQTAKIKERKVDQLLLPYIKADVISTKQPTPTTQQQNLFV